MNLTKLSINRPVATTMVMLIIILLGIVSLINLQPDLLPNINPPVAAIITNLPGASAQEVADLVTTPLEEGVAATSGLEDLRSISMENMSIVIAQFSWESNIDTIRAELAESIDMVPLPEDASDPMLVKFDPTLLPVMQISFSGDKSLEEITRLVEEKIKPRLETVDGVASVDITGGIINEVKVALDHQKLQEFGLTQQQIAGILQASNINLPAGSIEQEDNRLNLRLVGKFSHLDQLLHQVVGFTPDMEAFRPGMDPSQLPLQPVTLSEVGRVELLPKEINAISRTNMEPSVSLMIQKEGDANTVAVSDHVRQELEQIQQDYPDLTVVTAMDQADFIRMSIDNMTFSLLTGAFFALLVLLVFLRNIRSTLIIAVSIPFSVIFTFVLLYFSNLTLNIMTLGGLALGVGMLVDNSIVVIENIYRYVQEGEEPKTAAWKGTREVAMAVTASTLTTISVFLPIVFIGGITGILFQELALTVTFSLLASLIVALTVIPMLAAYWIRARRGKGGRKADRKGRKPVTGGIYQGVLKTALRHPFLVLVIAGLLLAGSIYLAPGLGTDFLPVSDEGAFNVSIQFPPGTGLEKVDQLATELEEIVSDHEAVELVSTQVGSGGGLSGLASSMMGGGGSNTAQISVNLRPEEDRDESTAEVMADIRQQIEDIDTEAEISLSMQSSMAGIGGGGFTSLEVTIAGPSYQLVTEIAGEVKEKLTGLEGITNLQTGIERQQPEYRILVDREAALRYGFTPVQVGTAVSNAVQGQRAGRLETASESYDIRLFLSGFSSHPDKVKDIPLAVPGGGQITVAEIAEIEQASGPVAINRENQRLALTITGQVEERDLGSVTAEVIAALDEIDLPEGYSADMGGMSELMDEGFSNLQLALILAIVLIYMVMASQFESLLYPFTILFSMPLAVIGVVAGLYISGDSFSITAFMGIIILAGIVVNNAIVLVDFINQRKNEGMETKAAIIDAAVIRLRPIMMTALTTMLGLLPLAIGLGEGAELQAPMAVAVIGGLFSSTMLTLVVIPVLYYLFDRLSGRTGPRGDSPAAAKERRRELNLSDEEIKLLEEEARRLDDRMDL